MTPAIAIAREDTEPWISEWRNREAVPIAWDAVPIAAPWAWSCRICDYESRYRLSRIPPFAKSAKDGAPRLFAVLPAVPNTNRGLIENLFLSSRPPALPTHRGMKRLVSYQKAAHAVLPGAA
jgi:hypothetical protein